MIKALFIAVVFGATAAFAQQPRSLEERAQLRVAIDREFSKPAPAMHGHAKAKHAHRRAG